MTRTALHYVHDPLCGWCYAAGPMVAAVAGAGVPVVLHGGGLWDMPGGIPAAKRAYIRAADARIAAMTGVPFGPAYLDGLLADPDLIVWSQPLTAATLAAGTLRPGADLRMLHAIQHAHYVDGRHVVEAAVLDDLAGSVGLPVDAFAAGRQTVAVTDHIAASRRLMERTGIRGFPGFLLERDGDLIRVDHEPFYGRPDEFAKRIEMLAAGLSRS